MGFKDPLFGVNIAYILINESIISYAAMKNIQILHTIALKRSKKYIVSVYNSRHYSVVLKSADEQLTKNYQHYQHFCPQGQK